MVNNADKPTPDSYCILPCSIKLSKLDEKRGEKN